MIKNKIYVNFPFYKIYSYSGVQYLFDTRDNEVYQVESEKEAEEFEKNNSDFIREISTLEKNHVQDLTNKNAKTLILELTDNCNLRCTYCVFDDEYENERSHGSSVMPEKTIKDSMINFSKRAAENEWYLIFYGGEPLNAYKKIIKAVAFSNENNFNVNFSLTTNGILLTEDKFDFLIENDFLITVSIDGPQSIHDKRRLKKNGQGSFDAIIKNLNALKSYSLEYFKNRVIINCTVNDVSEITLIDEYLEGNEFPVQLDNIRIAPSIQKSTEIDAYINDAVEKKLIDTSSVLNDLTPSEKSLIDTIFQKIKYRELGSEAGKGKKRCVPFANRTYVRVNGDSQFCERIGDFEKISGQFNTVNSNEKLIVTDADLNVSHKILNEFQRFKNNGCQDCIAYNFCELCPASFIESNEFNKELEKNKCQNYRNATKKAMLLYINYMEKNQ